MPRQTVAETTIQLDEDRVRRIRLDFNALSLFEEATGKNVLRGFRVDELSIRDVRALLWACMVHEDPDLTISAVGSMIGPSNLQPVINSLELIFDKGMNHREDSDPSPLEVEKKDVAISTG